MINPEIIDPGSKIRTVIARRLNEMKKSIAKNGWLGSTVRVIVNPANSSRYLCIDGMHRISAMKELRAEHDKFKKVEMRIEVYPPMNEYTQCILADSNYYFECFSFILYVLSITLNVY